MSMKRKNEKRKIYLTFSAAETENLAKNLAEDILGGKGILKESEKKRATLLALEGDLGGGKTTFLKGFARGLGIKDKVLSPTFIILRKFKISPKLSSSKFQRFYHFDCYRLEKPKELLTLGFNEIISDPKNIVSIEWADKIKKILPREILWIKFKIKSVNQREIIIFIN